MNTLSFRTEEATKQKLDFLAAQQNRDRSYIINQALDYYIELNEWQITHIMQGVEDAKGNNFATDDEVKAAFDKWKK